MLNKDPLVVSKELKYRGEGLKGLVLYNDKEKVVYRLLKRHKGDLSSNQGSGDQGGGSQKKIEKGLNYVRNIILPLLGAKYVKIGKIVSVDEGFIDEINARVLEERPKHRLDAEVDPTNDFALCMQDACFIPGSTAGTPTYSVEIKTKCGYPAHSYDCCHFCMCQFHKVKTGQRKVISKYCPMDLYSGNIKRMKHALISLIATPGNNINIFKDGVTICNDRVHCDLEHLLEDFQGTNSSCVDFLMDLVVKALLHTSEPESIASIPQRVGHCRLSSYAHTKEGEETIEDMGPPSGSVLQRLLQLQKLDTLGIEEIHGLYKILLEKRQNTPFSNYSNLDGPDYSTWSINFQPQPVSRTSDPEGYIIQKIREYLVAATVKDCSVIVALQPLRSSETSSDNLVLEHGGRQFLVSTTVIDLDFKPPEKIPYHFKLKNEVVELMKSRADLLPLLRRNISA